MPCQPSGVWGFFPVDFQNDSASDSELAQLSRLQSDGLNGWLSKDSAKEGDISQEDWRVSRAGRQAGLPPSTSMQPASEKFSSVWEPNLFIRLREGAKEKRPENLKR